MARTGPTNYQHLMLLDELKSKALTSPFWRRVKDDLEKSTRSRSAVNVYKIEKHAQDGETILVAGKVLSVGEMNKKVAVAALSFSAQAKEKIINAKGTVLSIHDLLKKNPEGKNVRILQ